MAKSTSQSKYFDLELSHGGRVATLTLHEDKFNLLNTPALDELLELGTEIRTLPKLRLVILTGAGERAFIGGADIREMAEFTPHSALRFIDKVHQACHLFRALPVPSIARVRGYCLGAGMEIAACCDLRIASDDSHFGMPEVQLGLPSVVEAAMLPTLIGWGRTRDLLYTGRITDAVTAYEIGFIEAIATPEALDETLQPWIDQILAADPAAIRAQKRLIEGWLDSGVAAGVQAGMDAFTRIFDSGNALERTRDFLARKAAPKG